MAKKASLPAMSINSVKHSDKRANIPTEELRDFVADDEKTPKTVLYPRDPSLDPQLVWKGKDEQDNADLEVPAVPIYIQEKIHPHSIIESFRSYARQEQAEEQLGMFSNDFDGLEFDKQIDFYTHKDGMKWANRMILGDSLLVMNSLAEKEGLKGKVQMIYLDPPYGIKFGSNWQVSTRKRDVKDGKVEDATRQPEQIRAFRDTWEKGIHSYLAYLRDRLVVARELLTETGSVFVQIGDENVHLVRCLMDEIFGAGNFFAQINFKSLAALGQSGIAKVYDYIIWYAKDIEKVKFRPLWTAKDISDDKEYRFINDDTSAIGYRKLSEDEFSNIGSYKGVFRRGKMTSSGFTLSCMFSFNLNGVECNSYGNKSWRTNRSGIENLIKANRLFLLGNSPYLKQYYDDFSLNQIDNCWSDQPAAMTRTYVVQTAEKFIQRCLLMTTDPGDLALDPTCGSGTTACVAEQWGRRWITIDTSRVALALTRTRLMSTKFPYYLLADSPEGRLKEQSLTSISSVTPVNGKDIQAQVSSQTNLPWETNTGIAVKTEGDIKKGFVNKRVPHVTLKAIANSPDIDTIHTKWQRQIEPIRTQLNSLLGKTWEEWEIPRELEATKGFTPTLEAIALLAQWWDLRKQRQQEIDAAIALNAETEILYDQPYEDNKRIRVTGPFTVESLSPHRFLPSDAEHPTAEIEGQQQASDEFEVRIIENLRKAGVQNTIKQERLKFDHLEPYAGQWLNATGEFTDAEGKPKRVAVSIGPEYGTVSSEQIKEAAKEAVKGLGYDLLIVCGFAFDPNVQEESKRYGKLPVLVTRMNSDLLLGDDLLKKTGAANLFMVFGEPDMEVQRQEDGKLVVTLNGLDIYDPTTGEIRSNAIDDIACWFIDTNYDGESFFVRHAYFTGADQPYEKLKRALKAEIDESAWSALNTNVSRPFDTPKTKDGKLGKIAIKVINHYGDEVLKVHKV
ncbi:MAG: site-specific DNA-methyltransferase [Stenomitos rutilans HA7619-LM2]|jgi:adenine-specific DNA-methyltransferase|nr:site-specific DNA-methyltransferase [Stenomitos rutilans HA7619-LM2]